MFERNRSGCGPRLWRTSVRGRCGCAQFENRKNSHNARPLRSHRSGRNLGLDYRGSALCGREGEHVGYIDGARWRRITAGAANHRCIAHPRPLARPFVLPVEKRLVTGDLLFCGKVGGTGTHFPGSSSEEEWSSLKRITGLPDDICVFPGHDYYGGEGERPHSTIGYERQYNPFLLCKLLKPFSI